MNYDFGPLEKVTLRMIYYEAMNHIDQHQFQNGNKASDALFDFIKPRKHLVQCLETLTYSLKLGQEFMYGSNNNKNFNPNNVQFKYCRHLVKSVL
jgi:hypothetical protein